LPEFDGPALERLASLGVGAARSTRCDTAVSGSSNPATGLDASANRGGTAGGTERICAEAAQIMTGPESAATIQRRIPHLFNR
ncbi:MAG: hypothetical protein ACYDDG_15615, partial [Casimicrobiaceae bacterium]